MAARAIIHLILQLLLVASSFVLVANNNWDDNEARSSSIAIITANAQFTSAEYTYDDYLDQSFDGLTEEQKLERQLLLLSEELAGDPTLQLYAESTTGDLDDNLIASVLVSEQLREQGILADGDVGAESLGIESGSARSSMMIAMVTAVCAFFAFA